MKTNKSYTKRLRKTRTGKLIARKPGQNHFNAKESVREKLSKGRTQNVHITNKAMQRFMPGGAK